MFSSGLLQADDNDLYPFTAPKVMNAVTAGLSSAVAAGASAFKDALAKK